MRYAGIDRCECVNGKGWGVTLFTQGCIHQCNGCFSKSTWDYKAGKKYTNDTKKQILEFLNKPYITRVTFCGGEPLLDINWIELGDLILEIKARYPYIQIWIYTGFTYEELIDICNKHETAQRYLWPILNRTNVLIDGRFVQEEKDITLAFKGSRNQRIINCKETIRNNKIILYDLTNWFDR